MRAPQRKLASKPDETLTFADAVRYHMSTPRNPMEIGVLLFLKSAMSEDELERFVSQRLLKHRRFRQRVSPAPFPRRPRWQTDAEFTLADHVSYFEEPALDQAQLAARVAQRLSLRLPAGCSPWRMDLFPLRTGGSALHLRVHHCLADGRALVRLLCDLADAPHPPPSGPAATHPVQAARPMRALELVRKAGQLGAAVLDTLGTRADARQLHTPNGDKRVAWSEPLALSALMQLAELHGCHVTDVLLTATAAALARGLEEGGLATPPSMRALVPTGAGAGQQALGNHYASAFVELAVDEREDVRRLACIAEGSSKLRDPAQARLSRTLLGLAAWVSPPLMRRAVDFLSRRASVVMSNVPGPAERIQLLGHELEALVAFAPAAASIGVSFTLLGYAGTLQLGVESDAALPFDPEQLAADFTRALRSLSRAGPST